MAGDRQSRVSHRREQQTREAATQERITLAAIGVLAAVAIIAAAGVIWGVVLPPRAHVITVGNAKFDARAVEQRAEFLAAGSKQPQDDPIAAAIDLIRRDETLLQAGASEAGDISSDDMTKAIRKRLDVKDDASADEYAKAYEKFLKGSVIDKATFERMVRAQVIFDRLAKKFEPQVGDAGLQYHLFTAFSQDQSKLKQFRDDVNGGADFVARAAEMGLSTSDRPVDYGWLLPLDSGFLHDIARVNDLQPGQMTGLVPREDGLGYYVFKVTEREEKRTYTDTQKTFLAEKKVTEWVTQQRDKVKIAEDLSDRERAWMTKRLQAGMQKLAERRQAAPAQGK